MLRRVIVATVIVVLGFLATPFALQAFGFFTWSRINCHEESIDIYSGRFLVQRWYWYRLVSDCTVDTSISKLAPDNDQSEFVPVNTFSFLNAISPHYHFHGVEAQIHLLEKHWETNQVPEAERRVHVAGLLDLWQSGAPKIAAVEYIWGLSEEYQHAP